MPGHGEPPPLAPSPETAKEREVFWTRVLNFTFYCHIETSSLKSVAPCSSIYIKAWMLVKRHGGTELQIPSATASHMLLNVSFVLCYGGCI